jgi:hypothetical protein
LLKKKKNVFTTILAQRQAMISLSFWVTYEHSFCSMYSQASRFVGTYHILMSTFRTCVLGDAKLSRERFCQSGSHTPGAQHIVTCDTNVKQPSMQHCLCHQQKVEAAGSWFSWWRLPLREQGNVIRLKFLRKEMTGRQALNILLLSRTCRGCVSLCAPP